MHRGLDHEEQTPMNFEQNITTVQFMKNALENIVCEMAANLYWDTSFNWRNE